MRPQVFVDTGAWVAVVVRNDGLHERASKTFRELLQGSTLMVTSDYVVCETATRIRYGSCHRTAARFLDILDRGVAAGTAVLARVEASHFDEARRLFLKYEDQDFSFVDCTSFALARALALDTVFGYDAHFRIMGFDLVG